MTQGLRGDPLTPLTPLTRLRPAWRLLGGGAGGPVGEGRLVGSRLTLLERLRIMAPRELPPGVTAFLLGWRGLTAVRYLGVDAIDESVFMKSVMEASSDDEA